MAWYREIDWELIGKIVGTVILPFAGYVLGVRKSKREEQRAEAGQRRTRDARLWIPTVEEIEKYARKTRQRSDAIIATIGEAPAARSGKDPREPFFDQLESTFAILRSFGGWYSANKDRANRRTTDPEGYEAFWKELDAWLLKQIAALEACEATFSALDEKMIRLFGLKFVVEIRVFIETTLQMFRETQNME